MGKEYLFEPKKVKKIKTGNRVIKTEIPVKKSKRVINDLKKYEPRSMSGLPLIVWNKAKGVHIYDAYGNKWLDFSSGVLVTNAGHGRKEITKAIVKTAKRSLHHNYCFPSKERADLAKYIIKKIAPPYFDKVFLLTTGSEAVEAAIKIARNYAHKNHGNKKDIILSFDEDFHGRTLGSQLAGGIEGLKGWIVNRDPDMVNVPIPDGFRGADQSFDHFLRTLEERKVNPENIAAFCMETYQGGTAIFLPNEYMKRLREFCDKHEIALIFDEVQSGVGRTGKMWGFEHYGVKADLICAGKGISSGLPLSAVIGPSKMMDLFDPGSMTSTHTGNPVCSAAALANLKLIRKEKLTENAAKLGVIMEKRVMDIWKKYPDQIGFAASKGLVAAIQMVTMPGTTEPDHNTAYEILKVCIENGLMLFAPVGTGGGTVKLAPPLNITEAQLIEGLDILEEAFQTVLELNL